MIRVLIADDHPLMRDALRACLEDEPDIEIAAEVTNGQDAVQTALELFPEVMMIDLYLPDRDGIQVTRDILTVRPDAHIMIFTSSTDEDKVAQAIQAGALGYLIKDSPRSEILQAIHEISRGQSFLSSTAARKLANVMRQSSFLSGNAAGGAEAAGGAYAAGGAFAAGERLTQREGDILALVGEGASNSEIAQKLHIGETTVRTHIAHILRKKGLKNRSELMMALLQDKRKLGTA